MNKYLTFFKLFTSKKITFILLILFNINYSFSQGIDRLEDSNDIPEFVNIQNWTDIEIISYLFGTDLTNKISNVNTYRLRANGTDKGGIWGFNDFNKVSGPTPFSDFSTGIMFSTGEKHPFSNTSTSFTSFGSYQIFDNFDSDHITDRAGFSFTYNSPVAGIFKGRFIFASEEYPNYNNKFRDNAVIKVNNVNYAKINGRDINTSTVSSSSNSAFYVNNSAGIYGIEADGFTKVITFEAPIKKGNNNIQIYIEDRGSDSFFDSWFYFTPYFTLPEVCPPTSPINIPNPTIYISNITNLVNLVKDSNIDISNIPPSFELRWFKSIDHDPNSEVLDPTSVGEGIYYVFLYNPDNFCYNEPARIVVEVKNNEICYNEPENKTGGLATNVGITTLDRSKRENMNDWPYNIKGAWLALESKSKGLVISRMSAPEIFITNPIIGMMVYDTDELCLKIYTSNNVWKCFNIQTCQQ